MVQRIGDMLCTLHEDRDRIHVYFGRHRKVESTGVLEMIAREGVPPTFGVTWSMEVAGGPWQVRGIYAKKSIRGCDPVQDYRVLIVKYAGDSDVANIISWGGRGERKNASHPRIDIERSSDRSRDKG